MKIWFLPSISIQWSLCQNFQETWIPGLEIHLICFSFFWRSDFSQRIFVWRICSHVINQISLLLIGDRYTCRLKIPSMMAIRFSWRRDPCVRISRTYESNVTWLQQSIYSVKGPSSSWISVAYFIVDQLCLVCGTRLPLLSCRKPSNRMQSLMMSEVIFLTGYTLVSRLRTNTVSQLGNFSQRKPLRLAFLELCE